MSYLILYVQAFPLWSLSSVTSNPACRVVDFGPSVDAEQAFAVQKAMNPPGKSPPFCSEF